MIVRISLIIFLLRLRHFGPSEHGATNFGIDSYFPHNWLSALSLKEARPYCNLQRWTMTKSWRIPLAWMVLNAATIALAAQQPSFLTILVDDVGYGDISAYNQPCKLDQLCPSPQTPKIDQMAKEGMLLTDFYTAHASCTPSRAAMLTGRLPIRLGVFPDVYTPLSNCGLPHNEVTVAESLREHGYDTSWVGKWHLGHLKPFLPTEHGFNSFYGMPYSHDMCPCPQSLTGTSNADDCHKEEPGCPLMENEVIVEQPTELQSLSRRYADRAINFLEDQAQAADSDPFFLMVSFQHAHEPQFISPDFNHTAPVGPHQEYSDSMLELDYHVGRILDFVRNSQKEGSLSNDLIVMLASDNGPSLISQQYGGSPGELRCGKSTTWEGGHRVPSIVWGPQAGVPGGVVSSEMVSNLDWMPTILSMANIDLPNHVLMDGVDVSTVFLGKVSTSPRDTMFFYGRQGTLNAVRHGRYKMHYYTSGWGSSPEELCGPKDYVEHNPPLLFDLEQDVFESSNIASNTTVYKAISRRVAHLVEQHNATMTVGKFTLTEDELAMPWPPQPFEPWVQNYEGELCVDVPPTTSQRGRGARLLQADEIDRLTWYESGASVYKMEL